MMLYITLVLLLLLFIFNQVVFDIKPRILAIVEVVLLLLLPLWGFLIESTITLVRCFNASTQTEDIPNNTIFTKYVYPELRDTKLNRYLFNNRNWDDKNSKMINE